MYEQLNQGFKVISRRCVVERSATLERQRPFSWLGKQRRSAKDDERLPERLIHLGMSPLMLSGWLVLHNLTRSFSTLSKG